MPPAALQAKGSQPATRNPERSRERILTAAFHEFAANGFAGARVDTIAARAGINKRMLYHYFGGKEKLFREVLRRKMAERQTWGMATPDDPAESLPYWFELACKDPEWIRLLEWEALQFGEEELIDQAKRRESTSHAVERIYKRQMGGHLSAAFPAPQLLLAMVALTWFPLAFPQLTRLITGKSAASEQFRSEQRIFLRQFAQAMRPQAQAPNGSARPRRNSQTKPEIA